MIIHPIKKGYAFTETQGFGITQYASNYAQFGMIGHNGRDYACATGTPGVFVANGVISASYRGEAENSKGFGNHLRLMVPLDRPNAYYEFIYGHLLTTSVNVGDKVKQGGSGMLTDNTGFSTGPHLHFMVREMERRSLRPGEKIQQVYEALDERYVVLNYDNGYFGAFDPEPLFEEETTDIFPVDVRYGEPYSWARETKWSTLYNEKAVMAEALKNGFSNVELPKLKKAFVYGYWDKQTVLDPAKYALWANMTKPEFLKRLGK